MEIRFHDPNEVPLPPEEVRIRALGAQPWPDGRRVAVEVQTTPFQQRPNLHVRICDAQGQEVASTSVMHLQHRQVAFTMHLRHPETSGAYTVSARLVYPDRDQDLGVVDQAETDFEIP